MEYKRFGEWRRAALNQVRFWPDHDKIGEELEAHYQDHRDDLIRIGWPEEEAEAHAVAALGDPEAVGKALDREHSPWLGTLFTASKVALVITCFLYAYFIFSGDFNLTPFVNSFRTFSVKEAALGQGMEWYDEEAHPAMLGDCVAAAGKGRAVQARDFTLTPVKALEWEWNGAYKTLMTIEVEWSPRYWGMEPEFDDELCVRYNGGEADNIGSRFGFYEHGGSYSPAWASVYANGYSVRGFRNTALSVELATEEPAEWVELYYPYGDNNWTLRIELEAVE